jgi:hypothetical protein
VLLADGYLRLDAKGFDRERAIFPDQALAFIRTTEGKVREKLETLHGEQTGAWVLESPSKWLDTHGTLATLRHGFKRFGKTLRIAFFRPTHGLNPDREARYQGNRLGLTRQLHVSLHSLLVSKDMSPSNRRLSDIDPLARSRDVEHERKSITSAPGSEASSEPGVDRRGDSGIADRRCRTQPQSSTPELLLDRADTTRLQSRRIGQGDTGAVQVLSG